MTDFFRFPHTPHLACLGNAPAREDKVLGPLEARELLTGEVLIEEKVDGANVGVSVDETGELRAQNRGKYLERQRAHPQFKPLFRWVDSRSSELAAALAPDLVLFGEWCYAVHSVRYDRLPDWFLAFDVYDRRRNAFWSASRRDRLVAQLGLSLVPRLAQGHFDLAGIRTLLGPSRLGDGPAEGLYVRKDEGEWLAARAKLVRSEFVQAIDEHWSKRALETNALATSSAS
jgi:ATP-dependent RNA circularization protein (DNA/RNA ligase family)